MLLSSMWKTSEPMERGGVNTEGDLDARAILILQLAALVNIQ